MKKAIFILLLLSITTFAQIPAATHIQILKAEDARRYDQTLSMILNGKFDDPTTARALLAAGRIGDERAIPDIEQWFHPCGRVAEMARFALGEIESIKAADTILHTLSDGKTCTEVQARAVEAAGKIAAANPKEEKSKELGKAILTLLTDTEGDSQTILLALTAALRARPEGTDIAAAKFLTHTDARVRADAANTLARVRAKNANEVLRKMVESDPDPDARANAARALGAADDKDAFDILLKAATADGDLRVRVSAIRSLGALKNAKAVDRLIIATGPLLTETKVPRRGQLTHKNELLEIATTLGRLLENTNDDRALRFLSSLRQADNYTSPEPEIAFARIAPEKYLLSKPPYAVTYKDAWAASAFAQGMQTFGASKDEAFRAKAGMVLIDFVAGMATLVAPANQQKMLTAMPDLMRALAALQPDNLDEIMRDMTTNDDVFIRAAAAEILADRAVSKENIDALNKAWSKAFIFDKVYDDAMLATLDALYKLDKKEANGALLTSLNSPDYLVRKKAFDLLATADTTASPGIPTMIESARSKKKDQVLPYTSSLGTKLGQVLNADADYRRALARKNGKVKAIFTTEKGTFTIDLLPEDAPLTVDNFIKLAKSNYFNGLEVHRVVPNFVMQDGDPRGDGNGGPGWSIRCEINTVPFERGAVGMALSGKDTGGSQWFAAHAPQPHLDGGYTVFGRINEPDMKTVDNIVRGDKIISVKIIEGVSPQRTRRN